MTYLMRITGLTIYGEQGLTPAASKNLMAAAVFLLLLWMLDAAAWTLLVNMIVTGKTYHLSLGTLPALVVGIGAATGILFYESSFITADLKHTTMPKVAMGIRLSVVLLFAIITSVPLDMHLLDSQINRRIHEEQVLQQLPPLVREWQKAHARMSGDNLENQLEVTTGTVKETLSLKEAESKHSSAQQESDNAAAFVRRDQGAVNSLRYRLSQANLDPDTRSRIVQELPEARAALTNAQRVAAQKLAVLQQARKEQADAELDVNQKKAELQLKTTKQASSDATRYEDWVHDLWTARPMTQVQERHPAAGDALTYDGVAMEGDVGFGERVIAMYDVLEGRPPRGPSMSSTDKASLQEMKLGEFVKGDQEAQERARTDASSLRWGSAASAILFTFFPLLIFALKMLFDADTKRYFDSDYQRLASGRSPDIEAGPSTIPSTSVTQ